jgi:hypothetical protein
MHALRDTFMNCARFWGSYAPAAAARRAPVRAMGQALLLAAACLAVMPVLSKDAENPAPRVVDLSSGSGSFVGDGPLLAEGNDLITFSNLPPGTYSYKLSLSGEDIQGLSASVNGQAAGTFTVGPRSFAGLEGRDEGAGSFTVQISGLPGNKASYQGVLTVTPEPQPDAATPLLLLGGLLALLGWAGWQWRRQQRSSASPRSGRAG